MSQQSKIKADAQPARTQQKNKVTDPSISRLNEEYATKITAGQISVTASKQPRKLSPAQLYDQKMKEKKLGQAERERKNLEKKLEYLDRSIKSMKSYDYASGKVSPSGSGRESSPGNREEMARSNRSMIRKLKEERLRLQQKKKDQNKRDEERIRVQAQLELKKLQQEKARKKQQILENMKKIKSRMENREEDLKRQEEEYKKIINGEILFKKLQQEYSQHESSLLEERKKKLANIRNLHKPVTLIEIEQHQRKFFEALQEKQSLRERQRRLNNAAEQYKVSYKSPHHKIYSQEHSRLDQSQNESKIKANKMKQFSEHVRENFVPQVDDRKRDELEKKIEEEHEKQAKRAAKEDQDRSKVEEIRNKGLRYLEEMRVLPKKMESQSQVGPVTERPRYKNYLTHSQRQGKTRWGSILESKVSKKDKAIRLQMQAQKLQCSLKLKQKKARVLKKDQEDVDQQYYEMIKAKLELLQI